MFLSLLLHFKIFPGIIPMTAIVVLLFGGRMLVTLTIEDFLHK